MAQKYRFHSFIADIFAFPVTSFRKCIHCESIIGKDSHDEFEISVDLAEMKEELNRNMKESSETPLFYLNDCLNYYFFQQKNVDISNSGSICPKCKQKLNSVMVTREIKNFPNYLCIRLDRFSKQQKEKIFIEYPTEELSMGDFFDVINE